VEVTIEGDLPDGGRDRVDVRVAVLVPWLVIKGMALHERIKEKDAFDIYYRLHQVVERPQLEGRDRVPSETILGLQGYLENIRS